MVGQLSLLSVTCEVFMDKRDVIIHFIFLLEKV